MLSSHCSELVVCSPFRWDAGRQRPQQLTSRLGSGVRTVYVEAPRPCDGRDPGLRLRHHDGDPLFTRAWLEVEGPERSIGFGDPAAAAYPAALADRLERCGARVVWLGAAAALPFVDALDSDVVVYDVTDDIDSLATGPPELTMRHRAALRRADVVFTGSVGLHRDVVALRTADVYCQPDGVERAHFERALRHRPARRRRPVAGYVGPIDERLDLDLVRGLAQRLPRWDLKMIGPVVIDPGTLPREPNLSWLEPRPYDDLPEVLAGVDVALMPFTSSAATRTIGPGTLFEFLSAGLPVVSTRWPEVVAGHAARVDLRDDVAGFASACQAAVDAPLSAQRRPDVQRFLERNSWDEVARTMAGVIRARLDRRTALSVQSTG
jgi:glycosyltransferase involved in cell wall biosynthesis